MRREHSYSGPYMRHRGQRQIDSDGWQWCVAGGIGSNMSVKASAL